MVIKAQPTTPMGVSIQSLKPAPNTNSLPHRAPEFAPRARSPLPNLCQVECHHEMSRIEIES